MDPHDTTDIDQKPSGSQQTLSLKEAIDLAMQHHTAGDLPKAEGISSNISVSGLELFSNALRTFLD